MGNVECKLVTSSAKDTVRMTNECEVVEVSLGFSACQHYLPRKVSDVPDVTDSCRRTVAARGALSIDELVERKG